MKTITISGSQFEISAPYAEGHVVTAAEARALNQVRAENVRNNMAKTVKEAESPETAAEAVRAYDAEYSFSMPGASAGRRIADPVEREATALAKNALRAHLKEQGRTFKDVDPDKLEAAIEKLANQPDTIKEAKKIVAAKQKTVSTAFEDLDLSSMG